LPVQNPFAFDDDTYDIFRRHSDRFLFELAMQINHPFELQPESVEVIDRLAHCGARLYSQNVLLKGVNDDIDILVDLYDKLRSLKVIPHYLFHAVPLRGTDGFRTSVARGLELARQLTSCGYLSGLGKPKFVIMTDIGKVAPYEGSILSKHDGILNIRTSYRLEDRLRWNPGYQLPEAATVNELGTLDVRYVDGMD
jgi:lysine 2,3-aminomutase